VIIHRELNLEFFSILYRANSSLPITNRFTKVVEGKGHSLNSLTDFKRENLNVYPAIAKKVHPI